MKLIDIQLSSLLFIVPLIHLLVSPHTKVEESFNLQAVHDILVYATPITNVHDRLAAAYDHFTFPGVVPRTFVGAVLLSGISQPLIAFSSFQHAQLIVRAVLGAFNAGCLLVFRNALASAYGNGVARWWTVMLITQFHVMYYLSRTLPNMFAFGLTTLAFAFILPKSSQLKASRRRKQAIVCLTLAAAVFRSELAILLATTGGYLLVSRQMSLTAMVPVFLTAFIGSLTMSVPIDSYFWQRWLWPELAGFYYNTILGSASNWGVSSWHYYFSSALPRLLLNPLAPILIIFSLAQPGTSRQAQLLTIPSLLFVAIYSFQPHKEARFIFYAIPPLTAAAALGANYVSSRISRSVAYRLATYSIAASIPFALALSSATLLVSSLNYPGGDALVQLQSIVARDLPEQAPDQTIAFAHADVLTCMTGLSLFGQNPHGLPLAFAEDDSVGLEAGSQPLVLINKAEKNATLGWPVFWKVLDYALEENPALPMGDWEVLGVVQGFDGIEFRKPGDPEEDRGEQSDTDAVAGENNVLGLGATLANVRRTVREYTGGWWIGPRMAPRIRIMKKFERV
ncbi:alpha-1,6- mannosyltransferase [Amphichorda felina]